MEWIQSILDSGTTPVITAFLLGLLTALSPCPLATNIAAIGYIGRDIESGRQIFRSGILYTVGRILAYSILGIILIMIIKAGTGIFGVQNFIAKYGEKIIGPALILIGIIMPLSDRLNLPSIGFGDKGEGLAKKGGIGSFLLGVLFALAFCPSSGIFYFGMLIPISAAEPMGYLLPVIYAIATALPVIIVAWIPSFSAGKIGKVYGKMKTIQKWMNIIVSILFICIGIYYCITVYM